MTSPSKQPTTSEPALAHPPRYWWLKRVAIASALVLAALAGLRWWWGIKSAKLLAAEIAAFHARGEPILPEDFAAPEIPDADNGASYLKQAADALDETFPVPSTSNRVYPGYFPLPKFWVPMAKQAIATNQKTLSLAREARRHDRINWGITYSTPMSSVLLTHLNGQRSLTNFLGDAAIYAHLQGDDAEAMGRIEDILFQVRAIDQESFLISHLVAVGIQAVAIHRIEMIAPGLTIASDNAAAATSPNGRPADRAQVKRIIQLLLDEQAHRQAVERAYRGEQMDEFDTLRWIGAGSILRPMFELDAVRLARRMRADVAAVAQPDWPAAKKAFVAPPARKDLAAASQMYSFMLASSLNRAAETHFRGMADRRLAAVSLAVRLYVIDHGGAYPPSLKALVPEYLSYVPLDPMAGDGRTLGYVFAEPPNKRPMAYSVGPDGVDNTDAATVFPRAPMYGWETTPDQWRDLSRIAPPPLPSLPTQPSDNSDSPEAEKN